jgi:hypothetical protein
MSGTVLLKRRTPLLLLATAVSVGMVGLLPAADAEPSAADDPVVELGPPEAKLALLEMADYATLSNLEQYHQIDLTHWNEQTEEGLVRSAAFVTDDEIALLGELGVDVLDVDPLPSTEEVATQLDGEIAQEDLERALSEQDEVARDAQLRAQALGTDAGPTAEGDVDASSVEEAVPAPVDQTEDLSVLRADTFSNYVGDFLSFEVRSLFSDEAANNSDRPDRVEIEYRDGPGEPRVRTLTPFVDAGQYIYHRLNRPVWVVGSPDEVTVRLFEKEVDDAGEFTGEETLVEELTVPTEPWAPIDDFGYPDGFQRGFVGGYLDSVDSTDAIFELAEEFDDLAEIIELPYETAGYQRKAMALYTFPEGTSTTASQVVNVESLEWGHLGGNDLTFEIANDGTPDQELGVEVDGEAITVTVATDGDGETTSTAAEVVSAVNADDDADDLVRAFTYRGSDGAGTVATGNGALPLDDHLNAPEDKIDRGPRKVYALRIGKHRDGSKTGVYAYSQEHAREWVTPVVAVETASRLLHNYGTDPDTTAYVDELDIFIIPTVNPDGADYSLYDNQFQRRNLTNYCDEEFSDVNARNAWGVDLNRNFREYNLDQGYSGASTSCTSDIFAGPDPLSEPEAANEAWVVDENPNIRFSMNIHTHGGYFMWAPGAYANPGRVPAPRPELGVEDYFFAASETILGKIGEHRGTVIEPGRTGPIIDVLYSAAGNSADDYWYGGQESGNPVFGWSFEAGANRYSDGAWRGVGTFFPEYVEEGFNQAMEFSNGIYGMLQVAYEFENDDQAPTTTPNVRGDVNYDGPADVFFDTDEPATIHYTLDGSEPTLDSETVQRRGARDGAAPIHVDETTTLRWFGVDAAGNEEEAQQLTVHIGEDPATDPEPGDPLVPDTCPAAPFLDRDTISPPHVANVDCAAAIGLALGSGPEGERIFDPRADVIRAQVATLLGRMLEQAGAEVPMDAPQGFPDVDTGPHQVYVDALAELGIATGFADGTFGPSRSITRAQAATLLTAAIEYALGEELPEGSSEFADVGGVHAPAIDKLAGAGILAGRSDTRFDPQDQLTREQMAAVVVRSLRFVDGS